MENNAIENLEHICTGSIYIGNNTINMADYTGLIMAMIICSLNNIKHISVRSHSKLLSSQVTGMKVVRNVRLVDMVPIVHDLIKHFHSVNMMWIPKEQNKDV